MRGADDLVLCAGTVPRADFRELADAAVAGGFRGLSVSPPLVARARAEGGSDAGLRRVLAERGLEVVWLDTLLRWLPGTPPPPDGAAGAPLRATLDDFLRLADAIGGRTLNVAPPLPGPVDPEVAAEALAPVCDAAARRGLDVALEFLPWTGIPDAAAALEVVRRCGRPNAGLMVDAWHWFRGGGDLGAIRALPGGRVLGLQLDDAPAAPEAPPVVETLEARRLPGEGDVDLVGLVRALDEIGSAGPIGVEVFSRSLAAQDPADVARRAGEAARRILGRARAGRSGS